MQRIGRYEVERVLGEGGMGIVYAARDPQLGRSIAIKRLRDTGDPQARERLWREARAAAGVNHPRICQVYDVWDESGELCVAMELLAGESLAERISRGPLPLAEAIETELAILDALEALHASGIVHRDVKPSNVFLTPHGVKLLDFGLALAHGGATQVGGGEEPADATRRDAMRLTAPLTIVGTPRYMAPEQWDGGTITPAADLFAAGALLFEMLTGRPAFPGDNAVAIYHGILYRDPPALAGGPEILAIDRVLQGAISRRPADRYPSAAAMAADLRRTLSSFTSPSLLAPSSSVASSAASSVASSGASSAASSGASTFPGVRPVTRLVVLPLRLLRPDPEIEFLSFSLADAVSTSLSGLESLVVRSSAAASRFAADPHPNLASIASQLGVDAVLFGTLLRAGDQVRVSVQLVEAPAGTLLWSKTAQVGLRDLFQLQDDLAHEIVASLHIPLRSQSREAIARDVPVDPTAYQLYLRATDVGCSTISRSVLTQARDLYLASLEQDPGYAPAWARLGRIYRVMAKYDHGDATENIRLAGEAFRKALALNPDLSLAHNYYTFFEIEEMGRPREAMLRLLDRVSSHPADPHLFAGLVVACRFCGLLDASIAADRLARRLDPAMRTSVQYTYWMRGDFEKAIAADEEMVSGATLGSLTMMGRLDEALALMDRIVASQTIDGIETTVYACARSAMTEDREGCLQAFEVMKKTGFHDPEGAFLVGRMVARVDPPQGFETISHAVAHGFSCASVLEWDPWLETVRALPGFDAVLDRARAAHREAAVAFEQAGGPRLLGMGRG